MKAPNASGPTQLTEGGLIAGTIAYMAPEVLQGKPSDVRSDLWAVGMNSSTS
jgi:serine/threonine protein kinase